MAAHRGTPSGQLEVQTTSLYVSASQAKGEQNVAQRLLWVPTGCESFPGLLFHYQLRVKYKLAIAQGFLFFLTRNYFNKTITPATPTVQTRIK